jgi:hypothetical protein
MAIIRTKQMEKIFEGDIEISGSISVLGSAIFVQSQSAVPAITVSGAAHIVPTDIFSGSLYIQGLGTLADTGSNAIIDLGDESF